jgi:hypothetical protein
MMVHFQIGNSATTKTEVSETRIIVNFFPRRSSSSPSPSSCLH